MPADPGPERAENELSVRMWLFDHGAYWASRIGDVWARPFTWLEAYCNRRWHEEKRRAR